MTERYRPIDVKASSLPWAQRLAAIVSELHVESNERYRPTKTQTWCNVYATDVIAAMGLAAPRHWMTVSGVPAAVGKGTEMTANLLWEWFGHYGPTYGWMRADRETAERAADRGHLAVVCYRNAKGPGHVAIVLGVDSITQAGRACFERGRLVRGFGAVTTLDYFVQMERGGTPHPKERKHEQ